MKKNLITPERRAFIETFLANISFEFPFVRKPRKKLNKERLKPVSIFLFDLMEEEKVCLLARLSLCLSKESIKLSIDMHYLDELEEEELRLRRIEEERIRDYKVKGIKDSVSERFYYWFVGFIEGNQNRPFMQETYYKVWFHLKVRTLDFCLIQYICDTLKMPLSLSTKKPVYSVLTIHDPLFLINMAGLLFGTLYLKPYLYNFRFWMHVYNSLYPDLRITPYRKAVQDLPDYTLSWVKENSWFSGYFEAIGLFVLSELSLVNNKIFGEFAFIIPMRMPNENKLMRSIYLNYGGSLLAETTKKYKSRRKLFFRINLDEADTILKYFSIFSLKTKKQDLIKFFSIVFPTYKRMFNISNSLFPISVKDSQVLIQSVNLLNTMSKIYKEAFFYKNYLFEKPLELMYLQIAARLERKRVRGKTNYWAEYYADVVAEHIQKNEEKRDEFSEEGSFFLDKFSFFSLIYKFSACIKVYEDFPQDYKERPVLCDWNPLTDYRRAYVDSDWYWPEYYQYLQDCYVKEDYENYILRKSQAFSRTTLGFSINDYIYLDKICKKIFLR